MDAILSDKPLTETPIKLTWLDSLKAIDLTSYRPEIPNFSWTLPDVSAFIPEVESKRAQLPAYILRCLKTSHRTLCVLAAGCGVAAIMYGAALLWRKLRKHAPIA